MSKHILKNCDECGELHKVKGLTRIKGRLLCYHCKLHNTTIMNLPGLDSIKLNKAEIRKAEALKKRLKKAKDKASKLADEEKARALEAVMALEKPVWIGLSHVEQNILLQDMLKEGRTKQQALEELEKIKAQIKRSHKLALQEKAKVKPVDNFKTAWNMLVGKKE